MPQAKRRKKKVRLPRRERIHVAVHRYDNALYYKRLDPEAFAILQAIARGATVEKACEGALGKSKRTDADWSRRLQQWFHDWSVLGWFCRRKK